MRARDIMSSPAVTAGRSTPLGDVAAALSTKGFSALPVVDEAGDLIGIVSETDLRPAGTVAEVMTSAVVAIPAATDVGELAATMLNRHLRTVPIVDGNRVVGVVTRRDLIRLMARDESSVARDVRNRLEHYGGRGRWTVTVSNGVASIGDALDDITDRHVAAVLATAVPGVTRAEVVPRG